jgi:phosphoribosylanthranilate isomerase
VTNGNYVKNVGIKREAYDKMYLDNITITGADDHVDRNALYELSDKYSFVTWGILYYSEKEGTPRYPSKEWVEKFDRYAPEFVQRNVHLCGSNARDFCNGDLSIVRYSAYGSPRYDSIQVNIPDGMLTFKSPYEIADLFIRSSKIITTIIQMNKNNKRIIEALQKREGGNFVNILFDESRGKGIYKDINITPEIHELLGKSRCGFAGGINPDNIVDVMNAISRISNLHYEVWSELMGSYYHLPPSSWIDIESGVRTNNEFDLEKVKQLLEIVDKWMKRK